MALHPGERGVCATHGPYDEYCDACQRENAGNASVALTRRATDRQQMPTGDGEVVLGPVLAILDDMVKIREWGKHVQSERALRKVHDDLEARAEMGKAKYGTYLRVNNGRNVELDLYQEVLDAIMYSAQAELEQKPAGRFLYLLIDIARQLAPEV